MSRKVRDIQNEKNKTSEQVTVTVKKSQNRENPLGQKGAVSGPF